jgi:hypothetical protein
VGTLDRDARSIHGKLVYLGPAGAGKTANLELLARKLKQQHRGDLKVVEGEGGAVEHLPVSLGAVRGWETSFDIWAAPGGDEGDAARARLLADADGVVFVADLRRERHDATLAALEELLAHLGAAGRSLDDVALVVQYNHRDAADETAVERLHRRLGLEHAVSFDAVACEGKGVLQTLSALSKQVLALVRARAERPQPAPLAEAAPFDPQLQSARLPSVRSAMSGEDTVIDASIELEPEPEVELDAPSAPQWQVRTAGEARVECGSLVVPLQLWNESSRETLALEIQIRLTTPRGD